MEVGTELSKIDKLKISAIKIVSEKGFNQTSVSDIAKDANVSSGYLYRHYESKKELIADIVNDMQNQVIDSVRKILINSKTVENVCNGVVDYHYYIYINHPDKLRFMITLINDFGLTSIENQQNYLVSFCELFYENFLQKEGVRKDIQLEEVYIALIIIPLQGFALGLKGNVIPNQINKTLDIDTIKKISLRILKADK